MEPTISYPADLPITARKDDILAAIRDHQVVIVAGETGSGKTTQLPKICLELGRGTDRRIGHTQPRRIAARAVAERLAEELGTTLGGEIGYAVRFTDKVSEATRVAVLTDGLLLAEIQRDRRLRRYDTIIIDEAHERSLNIDFLLGYLKQLLPRRPDLKLVITSATIDTVKFAAHFDGAPVIEVSGRSHPVEIRYRPLAGEGTDGDQPAEPRDQTQAICDAIGELDAEPPGDVLVFLSGEREIRDTADALGRSRLHDTQVLPLYARLSAPEQHRVFEPHPGRRIVLATNVAETSLTVPGIRYVVDPGTARISRYSHRLKVQRLPIEPVSRASANQRAGRCGRLADGICIRLYSRDDYAARPEYTEPEMLRTSLAAVILQMAALGLGDVAAFPFVDPPDRRSVTAGVQLLEELGALQPAARAGPVSLTPTGRRLARLPVDPRLARMVLEADHNGCVREVIAIAAGLSIQDPRERPADRQEAAAQQHARFTDPNSDFISLLNLWRYLQQRQRELSSSAFRRMCRAEFLNYLRIREWQDVDSQLRREVARLGLTVNVDPVTDARRIHLCLLAGLLSHIGARDASSREFVGARGARFTIAPGSALTRKPPPWVMAAQLVETTRLWARVAAPIDPLWAERLGAHLVRRSYSEPRWERKRGSAVATEKVSLYGVPLVAGRTVAYGSIDPELARELFIRHALVEGDWQTNHRFFHENQRLLQDVADLENRARRRDLVVDDDTLFAFYDQRIPPGVVSAAHFDTWWKHERRSRPDLLAFWTSMLTTEHAQAVSESDYPAVWEQGDLRLPVSYTFDPGSASDGVSVRVPVSVLNRVGPEQFEWHVPGMRQELLTALIRTLPKPIRRGLVPAPDRAAQALELIGPDDGPLLPALAEALHELTGVEIPPGAWDLNRLPEHLRVTFHVVDGDGRTLAAGPDLAELKHSLTSRVNRALAAVSTGVERSGLRSWDLDALPRRVRPEHAAGTLEGYPALVDTGDAVDVRVLGSQAEQQSAMRAGVRRLLLIAVPSPAVSIGRRLDNRTRLVLSRAPYPGALALLEDCVAAAVDALVVESGGPPWDAEGFAALQQRVRARLPAATGDVVADVEGVMAAAQEVDTALQPAGSPVLADSVADATEQLTGLVFPGFVGELGATRMRDVQRYLQALARRLQRLPDNPGRDRAELARVRQIQAEYDDLRHALPPQRRLEGDVQEIRWMIEELRVSLLAPGTRTAYPVSEQRIRRAMAELTG